jgi:hypothetical protein
VSENLKNYDETLNRAILLLTSSYPTLRRVVRGMRSEDVTSTRFAETWHTSHLPMNWADTIGMWGGVASTKEIAARAGVELSALKMFKKRHSLKTFATPRIEQWKLAAELFVDYLVDHVPEMNLEQLCIEYGVLPIEAKFYIDRMSYALASLGYTNEDVMCVDTEQLRSLWNEEYYLQVRNAFSGKYTSLMGVAREEEG